jgi:hypothetical protein
MCIEVGFGGLVQMIVDIITQQIDSRRTIDVVLRARFAVLIPIRHVDSDAWQ